MPAQIRGDYLYKPVHEEEGRSCVGRVEVRFGWRRRVSSLWGSVLKLVCVYISNA